MKPPTKKIFQTLGLIGGLSLLGVCLVGKVLQKLDVQTRQVKSSARRGGILAIALFILSIVVTLLMPEIRSWFGKCLF